MKVLSAGQAENGVTLDTTHKYSKQTFLMCNPIGWYMEEQGYQH
jgi:hypothetical protein